MLIQIKQKFIYLKCQKIDPRILLSVFTGEEKNISKLWDETNDTYSFAVLLYEILFDDYLNDDDYDLIKENTKEYIKKIADSVFHKNSQVVKKEIDKYKENSKERKLLEFILKNIDPFEKKQTMNEVVEQYKIK